MVGKAVRRMSQVPFIVACMEKTIVRAWWWIIFVLLGSTWLFPVIFLKKAGVPWWVFLLQAFFWFVVFAKAESLYDWGILITEKLGMKRLAAMRKRMKPQIFPPVRMALLIIALISFMAIF